MTNAQVLNPCVGGRLTGSVSSFRIANPVIGPRDYKSRGAGRFELLEEYQTLAILRLQTQDWIGFILLLEKQDNG
jgi:hypothetical protein